MGLVLVLLKLNTFNLKNLDVLVLVELKIFNLKEVKCNDD